MPLTADVHADTVAFAALGEKICNDFRIDVHNRATFDAIMGTIRGCNDFDPERIRDTIEEIFDDATRIEYGHEGSLVLYVHIPFWTHQRIGETNHRDRKKYTQEERKDFVKRIISWGRSMRADEIMTRQFRPFGEYVCNRPGEDPICVRLWWD